MNIIKLSLLILSITVPSFLKAETNVAHAIAMHGDPKYPNDFKHVDYSEHSEAFYMQSITIATI